jgi:glycosyltransferase involved in cell wall biosynthesis
LKNWGNVFTYKFFRELDKYILLAKYLTKNSIPINNKTIKSNLKILYALNDSLPQATIGYAIRSHKIALALKQAGLELICITRVGFPWDLDRGFETVPEVEEVEGVRYHRLYKPGYHLHDTTISRYIANYTRMLIDFVTEHGITLLHGASDYNTGLASVSAARALGVPSIYEVRGFWEITRASRQWWFRYTLSYHVMKKLEIQACNEATSVIALSEIVKEELIARGIDAKKIYVVPNGVDTKVMKPLEKNTALLQKLQLDSKFIIGFVGSVVDYEGLSLLVDSAEKIENLHVNAFRYVIVGDGNDLEKLKKQVKKKSLEHLFVFVGRVPYEEVEQYYSIIDVACYPRLDWEVCRIVSPKKPFEAMAYGIPVVSSSVRANSYFIEDGLNGLIHDVGNSNSLTEKLLALYSDEALRKKLAEGGRAWVVKNRDSEQTGSLLKQIYQETQEKFYG